MSKNQPLDSYVYPNTTVLINKFDIRDQAGLETMEGVVFVRQNSKELPSGNFNYDHLKAIHHHFFHPIYAWAGKERNVDIAKGDSYFAHTQYITPELNKLFNKLKQENYLVDLPKDEFSKKLSYYFNELNAIHPFREGNGRTQRAFCTALAKNAGYTLDWSIVNTENYIRASIDGFNGHYPPMAEIFNHITIAHNKKIEAPTHNIPTQNHSPAITTHHVKNVIEPLLKSKDITLNRLGTLLQRTQQTKNAEETKQTDYLVNSAPPAT